MGGKSHAKGKSKGQRWDPQILMSLQMQPIPFVCLSVHLPILSCWVGTRFGKRAELADWQELAESRASHSHGLRMWETGALDWDYRD